MLPKLIFDCPYPKYIIDIEEMAFYDTYSNLIIGDSFIAMANHFFVLHTPVDYTRYLHLCNRFTRSWASIPFPALHCAIEADRGHRCQFKPLGFFRSTIMLVLVVNPNVPHRPFSLEYWKLSEDFESVRIVHKASITRDLLPTGSVECFTEEHKMRVFFTGVMRDAADNEYDPTARHCIALECTMSSSEAIETFAVDVEFDCNAIVLNDNVYLVDISGGAIFEYNNGTLVHITTVVPRHDGYFISGYGNNFYALTGIGFCALPCATEYDLTTGLWSSSIPSELRFSELHTASAGELLFLYEHGDDDDHEIELRILSMIPPKLSVLALRCLQMAMPEETATKMASSKCICDPISFVEFLFSSNNQQICTE